MNLAYHLHGGEREWSPNVTNSQAFVRDYLRDKTEMKIDYPESHGGTSTTGNVVRECFSSKPSQEKDFPLKCVLTLLPVETRDCFSTIHLNLAVILRVFNCAELVDCDFGKYAGNIRINRCEFKWASITPTLHKILGHSLELMIRFNEGRGMKGLSEEV